MWRDSSVIPGGQQVPLDMYSERYSAAHFLFMLAIQIGQNLSFLSILSHRPLSIGNEFLCCLISVSASFLDPT